MPNLRNLLFIALILFSFQANADFDFNANCVKAYKEIFSLKLNDGKALIEAEKKRDPNNAIPYLLDDYVDFLTILTSENKSTFENLKKARSARLTRIEKEDKNSPYYLFALGEIHMHWALIHGYFQEYFNSSMELKKAYSLLQDNHKKYPQFLPNQKNLAMLNAVLGSLPDGLKKTVSVFGMRGSTETGVKLLSNLLKTIPNSAYAHFYDDVVFCYSYVQTDILQNYTAYAQIISATQKIDSTSLLRSYIASYAAMRTAHNDAAISYLNNRVKGSDYTYFGAFDYMSGVTRLRKLDSSAATYFQSYLNHYNGINYIKDTYLNLAWLALVQGNTKKYNDYIQLVKTKGYALHEKDKQALKEAADPIPNTSLLKARLLFDGGYYEKALDELAGKKGADFDILRDKIEFCYRLGRIYDEQNRDDLALKFYQLAISIGSKERYFFASNAAYRMGVIYEKQKNIAKAKTYYKTAIDMQDHDYERSIETKCKEALNRIN